MRAANYDHNAILHSEVTGLNAMSATYRGELSRVRDDGSEISRWAGCLPAPYAMALSEG